MHLIYGYINCQCICIYQKIFVDIFTYIHCNYILKLIYVYIISLKRKYYIYLLYTLPTKLNEPKKTELCIYCKIIYIYKNMIVKLSQNS